MVENISVLKLAKMMLKKWWLFAIFIVLFAVVSFFYTTFFVQPVFISSGTIYVTSNASPNGQTSVNLSDVMLAQELVTTYSDILSSNTFLKKVSQESGLNYSYRELKNMVAYSPKEASPVMVVEAASYDPKDACIIAETILNNAQEEIARIIPGGVVSIIDRAEVPVSPSSPSLTKNILLAIAFAILLVGIYVFCTEFFDDRLKDAQEIAIYSLPVLAEIPFMLSEEETKKPEKRRKKKLKAQGA